MPLDYATPRRREPIDVRRMMRIALVSAVIIGVLVILIFAPGVVYQEAQDVDIRTGRVRHLYRWFGVTGSPHVEETAFSSLLSAEELSASPPDWRRVNTFDGGGRVSPHHAYHGAIAQIKLAEQIWFVTPFTDDAKSEVVRGALRWWQSTGGDWEADTYLRRVADIADGVAGRPVTVQDLVPIRATTRPSATAGKPAR